MSTFHPVASSLANFNNAISTTTTTWLFIYINLQPRHLSCLGGYSQVMICLLVGFWGGGQTIGTATYVSHALNAIWWLALSTLQWKLLEDAWHYKNTYSAEACVGFILLCMVMWLWELISVRNSWYVYCFRLCRASLVTSFWKWF